MKKFLVVFMALAFLASPVMAYQVSVSPTVGVNFYDEFDTAVSVGAEATVSELPVVPAGVELSTGLNYAGTTVNGSGADVDFYTIPLKAGYRVEIDDKLSVKPYAAVNVILADADKVSVDNTVGGEIGTEISYKVNQNWSAFGKFGWAFAETDVDGQKTALNGATLAGGATYKF